jgi:hypothetical protein
MRRFSLLSVLGLVFSVLVAVLGPAGVAAAGTPAPSPAGFSPQNHEPCDPDADNDCDQAKAGDQDPCDANDHDCTPDDSKNDGKDKGHDQDPCDPHDKDCTPDDSKDKDKGDKGKDGDAKKCDPDDKNCDSKDKDPNGDGGGDSALTEIVKNLLDR